MEVVLNVVEMLTLPATASLMQTCGHLRSLCMEAYTWESHSGDFRAINDKARMHYRLSNSQLVSPKQIAEDPHTLVSGQLAEPANYQRYSWCPVPGETHMRRKFSSGSKVAEPAWLTLMPHVSCKSSTWLYVKTKTLAGSKHPTSAMLHVHLHNAENCQGVPMQSCMVPRM